MKAEEYPFVQELITDKKGQVIKVVLEFEEYQRLLEAIEDEGLIRAMQGVKGETPLSLKEALEELEHSW
jgi:RelB Antitoxin alpha helical domain